MTRRLTRGMREDTRISEILTTTVTRRVIIPLKLSRRGQEEDYFVPAVKEVDKGDYVEWVNLDNRTHHLRFYHVSKNKVAHLFSFKIERDRSYKKKFDFEISRIDYHCTIHKNEIGTIVIYPKSEQNRTNTEQLRYLSKVFNIKPPSFLSHLGSD
jgi:plastocyanin